MDVETHFKTSTECIGETQHCLSVMDLTCQIYRAFNTLFIVILLNQAQIVWTTFDIVTVSVCDNFSCTLDELIFSKLPAR